MPKSDFIAWASAPPSWSTSCGDDLDGIVLSSRLRLARNFLGVPFSHRAQPNQLKSNLEKSFSAVSGSKSADKAIAFRLNELSQLERMFLMERQLISHELADKEGDVGLVVTPGEGLSIMINEEDHLRLACFRPGLGLSDTWELLSSIDDDIAGKIPFSYNAEIGYITACPTNIGTGLRASCLLHLPALVLTGKIKVMLNQLGHAGLTARGFYGEGTTAMGDLFQISNVKTLGSSESQIVKEVEFAVREIALLEKRERQNISESPQRLIFEDQISRSFGTLRWTRLLSLVEAMKHVSLARLGIKLGMDLPITIEQATSFFFLTQSAHLKLRLGQSHSVDSMEETRANFFKAALSSN